MSESVVYIVLTSGRELIASLEGDDGLQLTLVEPLTMESSLDEDDPTRRLVFMSRFSPYTIAPRVRIYRSAVALIEPASEIVAQYYKASLRYCERFSDSKFDEGMQETIEHISSSLAEQEPPRGARAPEQVVRELESKIESKAVDTLWKYFSTAPTSNTSH